MGVGVPGLPTSHAGDGGGGGDGRRGAGRKTLPRLQGESPFDVARRGRPRRLHDDDASRERQHKSKDASVGRQRGRRGGAHPALRCRAGWHRPVPSTRPPMDLTSRAHDRGWLTSRGDRGNVCVARRRIGSLPSCEHVDSGGMKITTIFRDGDRNWRAYFCRTRGVGQRAAVPRAGSGAVLAHCAAPPAAWSSRPLDHLRPVDTLLFLAGSRRATTDGRAWPTWAAGAVQELWSPRPTLALGRHGHPRRTRPRCSLGGGGGGRVGAQAPTRWRVVGTIRWGAAGGAAGGGKRGR